MLPTTTKPGENLDESVSKSPLFQRGVLPKRGVRGEEGHDSYQARDRLRAACQG